MHWRTAATVNDTRPLRADSVGRPLRGVELRIDAPGLSTLRTDDGHALLQGREGAALRVALTPLGRAKVCGPQAAVAGYSSC